MSDYKVPYTTIRDIQPHPNADRLEVATVYGFQVVTQKDKYKVGDRILYIPIDSILPQTLEDYLFPADSKIKLHNHRVRQIRIRGLASQGMLVSPLPCPGAHYTESNLETDFAPLLGITKYEPPVANPAQVQGVKKNRNKPHDHPLFHKYNGLDNLKWFPDLMKDGEMVVVQEKLHGTNARASLLPYEANTIWKRFMKWVGFAPAYEQHYGSNNVQISGNTEYKGYYGEDVYGKAFKACDVFSKLLPGEIVYGEIIGPGIQKGYDYGLKEHKFILFDVKVLGEDGKMHYLDPIRAANFASSRGFDFIPVLYRGEFKKELIAGWQSGPSVYHVETKVREGCVIKSIDGYDNGSGKRALKCINEDYLADSTNTDNH